MSNDSTTGFDMNPAPEFESMFQDLTESYMQAVEENVDAQAALFEQWTEAMEEAMDEEQLQEGYEGMMSAYEVWMDAAEDSFDRMSEMTADEEVNPTEFRDIWLSAANNAFKEVLSTTAFAAATGETTDVALDLRQEFDDAAMETLEMYGFATRDDMLEVGERLVELERRQHAIETKLDRILDHLAES